MQLREDTIDCTCFEVTHDSQEHSMTRIAPLTRADLAEFEEHLAFFENAMGFVPSSIYNMARVPGLFQAFQGLAKAALGNQLIPGELKQLIALTTSAAGGCRYCQAHAGHGAEKQGASEEKLRAVWEYETSDLFSEAERSALRVAFKGGQSPNAVTDEDFAAMKEHWDDDQATAIVAVIAMFGYLNRWNDTIATTLEPDYVEFGEHALGAVGWEVGKHA